MGCGCGDGWGRAVGWGTRVRAASGPVLGMCAEGQATGGRECDDDGDGVDGEVRVDGEVVHGDDCGGGLSSARPPRE